MKDNNESVLTILLILLLICINGFIIYALWNTVLVEVVNGVHEVSFWQAMCIGILSSILFKSTTNFWIKK